MQRNAFPLQGVERELYELLSECNIITLPQCKGYSPLSRTPIRARSIVLQASQCQADEVKVCWGQSAWYLKFLPIYKRREYTNHAVATDQAMQIGGVSSLLLL